MSTLHTTIGQSDVVADFLAEIAQAPRRIARLSVISPFVNLASMRRGAAQKLRSVLLEVVRSGGHALLISDDTLRRREEFLGTIEAFPELQGSLFLCPELHAKCGLATTRDGFCIGFLGSANLTDAGLHKNREAVIGIRGKPLEGPDWHLLGQLQRRIERIHVQSLAFSRPVLDRQLS